MSTECLSDALTKALGGSVICPVAEHRRRYKVPIPAELQHETFAIAPLGEAGFAIRGLERNESECDTNSSDGGIGIENCQPFVVGVLVNCTCVPGLYNVLAGIFHHSRKENKTTRLYLFESTRAFRQGRYEELTEHFIAAHMNMGGFTGTPPCALGDELDLTTVCQSLKINHLVILGPVSLAQPLLTKNSSPSKGSAPTVTLIPVDNNSRAHMPLGFDTVTKSDAEIIGNVAADAATCQDRYHFFAYSGQYDVMAVSLECLLQTRVNLCLSLPEMEAVVVDPWIAVTDVLCHCIYEICQLVSERLEIGKHYGLVLFGNSLKTILGVLKGEGRKVSTLASEPDPDSRQSRETIMAAWSDKLTQRVRSLTANSSISCVAQTLLRAVQCELRKRKELNGWQRDPVLVLHEVTDQACSAMPSNFDASLAYTYGIAASIIGKLMPGPAVASVIPIEKNVRDWFCGGISLDDYSQQRKAQLTFSTRFASGHFKALKLWRTMDFYRDPGPLQHEGPVSFCPPLIMSELEASYFYPSGPTVKANFPMIVSMMSPLHRERLSFRSSLNTLLTSPKLRTTDRVPITCLSRQQEEKIRRWMPLQTSRTGLEVLTLSVDHAAVPQWHQKVGVVLAGPPASGVSNVLFGLYERCTMNSSKVIGFRSVVGLIQEDYIVLERESLNNYVNGAGFELLGHSTRDRRRLRQPGGLAAVREVCKNLSLDGLVLVGGLTTGTDAALLTEDFLQHDCPTNVVFVPANTEFNIDSPLLEMSIGFDTRCQTYATRIGELVNFVKSRDSREWCIVRVSGKSPSRAAMEIAFRTHPDLVIIPEFYEHLNNGMVQAVEDIADTIRTSARSGKNYGIVLITSDLMPRLTQAHHLADFTDPEPSAAGLAEIATWPPAVQSELNQILEESEFCGFAIEKVVAVWISNLLQNESINVSVKGVQFANDGRSSMPGNFDCALATAHGYLAGILIESQITGVMTSLRDLCGKPEDWRPMGVPLAALLREPRAFDILLYGGQCIPMFSAPQVQGLVVELYRRNVTAWQQGSAYSDPGPLQFYGPVACNRPLSLLATQAVRMSAMKEIRERTREIEQYADVYLNTDPVSILGMLKAVRDLLAYRREQ